jgi:predicted RecB family nuclease
MSSPQTSYRKKRLSKSDYLAGLQCTKHLWLRINEPDSVELEPDDNLEALFEQGREIGTLARTYIPGGTLIDFPYYAVDDKLRATRTSMDQGCDVIYEAAFVSDNQFVAIDILQHTADGFIVTEVKSSTKVKAEHLQELALQAYVLEQSGIRISKLQVMHLNRDCVYPNLENLFVVEDVTKEVLPLIQKVEASINVQKQVLSSSLPVVQIGPQCTSPSECPFKNRCWADSSKHHVTTLYAMRAKKAFELVEEGYTTIHDLPADFKLSATAERQRRAVVESRLFVEPELADALKDFPSSIGFLDFETIGPAVPVWVGCRPYEAVPVQFSFCKLESDGELGYSEWLAEGPEDPREEIARALIEACRGVDRIAAYNAPFEAKAIDHLAKALPDLAGELQAIKSRLIDLLPLVRDHVYHPEFYGTFGLKQVLPALMGEDAYQDLAVSDGNSASWLLQALLLERERFTPEHTVRLRNNLVGYCRADTEGLAKLLRKLRDLNCGSSSSDVLRARVSISLGVKSAS